MNNNIINTVIREFFTNQCNNIYENIARIISCKGAIYGLLTPYGKQKAKLTGKFIHNIQAPKDYPVVGDYVEFCKVQNNDYLSINKVLKRKNKFSRKMPISGGRKLYKGVIDGGITEEQVMAANINYVLILVALDQNFNIARLERYILLAKSSDLQPVIVLTKRDLCQNYQSYINKVNAIDKELAVYAVSSITGAGVNNLNSYLKPYYTIALIGSSGVGKSTLLNYLSSKEVQKTKALSESSGKGKHTTTHREMFFLENNCMIIDMPGIKELQLWLEISDLSYLFKDIMLLEKSCKYKNCSHKNEAGCAIKEALNNNTLSQDRYTRYKKLVREANRLIERKAEREKKSKKSKRHN